MRDAIAAQSAIPILPRLIRLAERYSLRAIKVGGRDEVHQSIDFMPPPRIDNLHEQRQMTLLCPVDDVRLNVRISFCSSRCLGVVLVDDAPQPLSTFQYPE
jgi:hypothetical protein